MVIDQIAKYKFYTKFSNKYPNFYFLLFKIIPTFVMAPYIILKGNTFLKISGILFLLVDILILVNYYKNKFLH